MYIFLSILVICITLFIIIKTLQKKPITLIIHKKFEEIHETPKEVSQDPNIENEHQDALKGLNEVIQFTQEFLGGDLDAEPKR